MSANNFTISTRNIYHFTNIVWGILVFVFSIQILISIVKPTDIKIPIYFTVQNAGHIVGSESDKISITAADGILEYNEAYQPPLLTVIFYHVKTLGRMALIVFIFSQIRLILKNASKQNPFSNKNSQRLLWIGWATLAIGVLVILTELFAQYSFDASHMNLIENIDYKDNYASLRNDVEISLDSWVDYFGLNFL